MRLLGAYLVAAAVAVVLFGFAVWGTKSRRRRLRGNDEYYEEYDDDNEDDTGSDDVHVWLAPVT